MNPSYSTILILLLVDWSNCQTGSPETVNLRSAAEQRIAVELMSNYSQSVRPKGKSILGENGSITAPVRVNVTIWLIGLSSFDDVTMEFTAQIRFQVQQEWFDDRLRYEALEIPHEEFINMALDQVLWHPDTFFSNEKRGHVHLIDQPNQFVKVRSDGLVRYNKRLTMTFSCPMNLMLFPHDNQTCEIEFGSYAYTESDIILQWSDQSIIVEKSANDSLPKFSIKSFLNQTCTSHTATGTYSCLGVRLFLQREFSYFLLQLYIPSCMLVSVACVSFWIDWRSAPARVPLTIVTLLTITTQANGINNNLPPVSYTKAIDVWIGACVVFIFGSLIEYAIVNYIGSNEERRKAKSRTPKEKQDLQNHFNMGPNCLPNASPSPNAALLRYYGGWNCIELKGSQKRISLTSVPEEVDALFHNNNIENQRERKYKNGGFLASLFGQSDENATHLPFGLRFRRGDRKRNGREYRTEEVGDCFEAREYAEYRKARLFYELTAESVERRSSRRFSLGSFKGHSRAERIDMFSRILFPIGFVAFNIVYWSLYLPSPF